MEVRAPFDGEGSQDEKFENIVQQKVQNGNYGEKEKV